MLGSYMPHGMCYLWQPDLIRLHVISDAVIALAYFAIPFLLFATLKMRMFAAHSVSNVLVWFIAFIALCGLTHAVEVITVWYPIYWFAGGLKLLTALVSVISAIKVWTTAKDAARTIDLVIATKDYESVLAVLNQLRSES